MPSVIKIAVLLVIFMATALSSTPDADLKMAQLPSIAEGRFPRHTPFLPGDYWRGERPDFGPTETDVKVLFNSTAMLKCPISHVADSRISFIRQKDFHILSNGHKVYTRDKRFDVIHRAKSIDWILRINQVVYNDTGIYECQISGAKGSHSLVFHLDVMRPVAKITGLYPSASAREFHLLKGSTITLTCTVQHVTSHPQYILWYHGSKLISKSGALGDDASVVTTLDHKPSGLSVTKSTLVISKANPKYHSGNYTCKPSNAMEASVQLFVSEDRLSEPLKRPEVKGQSSKSSSSMLETQSEISLSTSDGTSIGNSKISEDHKKHLLTKIFSVTVLLVVVNHLVIVA